jgi:hypothetical protein
MATADGRVGENKKGDETRAPTVRNNGALRHRPLADRRSSEERTQAARWTALRLVAAPVPL